MKLVITSVLVCLIMGFTGGIPNPDSDTFGEPYRKINNKAFKAGERARYLVHYGFIDAGYADIEIMNTSPINGREMLKIVGKGESQGMVDFFFHVKDRYETVIDKESVFPWLFVRNISEGGYECHQTYKFYQHERKVETQKGKVHDVPSGVQDMLSAAFYARTLDITKLKKGDVITVPTFVDDEIFNLKIRYGGIQNVEIKSGTYRCYKFNPVIQTGRLFNAEEDMDVWISADANKLPVLCEAKILVGSVKVELTECSGLANTLARVGK